MKLISLLSVVGLCQVHTIFVSLEADGVNSGVSEGVRTPEYDGPQTDVTSQYIACNGPPNPTKPTDKVITVTAGSTVTAVWRHTLTSGPGDVMDASHKGPTLAYLKKVSDAKTDTGIGAGWFKIQEDGLSSGVWGTERVINNQGRHTITIPKCIANGQYLLRAEMIALHGAGSYPGAQLYMECAQINVVGGTGAKSPSTASIPGIYKGTDPGITLNIYYPPVTNYAIPGPAKFTC
ncbi:glycosyl hydrolase family 61 protein [Colletotrichum plurivorum]|uniref:lytic cellulose monooxygenase (C4-dehydrogenating) n=1 Tax=Colletotrichum plurivorum TaxID=2175906 RepID=A0A8H6K408_9PEZI|nr:glycosyl hydrolase family 61 protein [Colletotrichum plurivorum]